MLLAGPTDSLTIINNDFCVQNSKTPVTSCPLLILQGCIGENQFKKMSSINSVLRCIHRLFGISRLVFAKVCRFTQMIRRICRLTMPANENKRLAVESHCVCCDEGMISYFSKRFKIKGLCNERYKIKAQID